MTLSGTTRIVEVTPPSRFDAQWAAELSSIPATPPAVFLGVGSGDVVLVVGAHPDDETFGAGATIASLVQAGVEVHALSLSSGEAALHHVDRRVDDLAARRASEYAAACQALGIGSSTVRDFPDSGLAYAPQALSAAVADIIQRVRPAQVLTVWWGDPHPDHRATGEAAVAAAKAAGCPVSGFAVWAPHWLDPAAEPASAHRCQPMLADERARAARKRAVDCYRSQTEPLAADLAPILPAAFVEWTTETLVRG